MKLPKRLDQVIKRKDIFLDEARAKLENTTLRLQVKLFEQVIEEIIPKLDVEGGKILETANNYRLISQIDKVYDTFNEKVVQTILPQINKALAGITRLNTEFFALTLAEELPKRFEKIIEATRILTELKIGIRAGKMIRGGNIMEQLRVSPAEFKQLMSKAVTSRVNMRDFIKIVKENINGTEKQVGALERQLKRYAYDTYQQYDRAYNKKLADEFGMTYFLYDGGLIRDSRDFCACHNGKVFHNDETQEWKDWTPSKCESYPEGYEVKAKDIYSVPSYLGYPGYDPFVDAGGYNCRHVLAYITDTLAFRMRPGLKK